jgi:hypothetical protein
MENAHLENLLETCYVYRAFLAFERFADRFSVLVFYINFFFT